jgi:hypothetical protein
MDPLRDGADACSFRFVLQGRFLAEGLRVGHDVRVAGLTVVRIGRHDVSQSTIPFDGAAQTSSPDARGASSSQPSVWTFVDFEAPDERAGELCGRARRGVAGRRRVVGGLHRRP